MAIYLSGQLLSYLAIESFESHSHLIAQSPNRATSLSPFLDGQYIALGGSDAVRCWRTERIDLAVIDIWMPEKDGLETIMEIRRITPNAKIIAMSGVKTAGPMDPLALAARLGARQSLRKPFLGEELLHAISDLLHPATVDAVAAIKP